jgi:hypothetical protein
MLHGDYSTPPDAVRVFTGFRHPDLTPERFRSELGQTFMPGTPYMLQPLGLAAYLAATFRELDGRALPHEVALITWRSQAAQRRATRETLRGRMYTQSHGGVYTNMAATFPLVADKFDPHVNGSLYLFERPIDWQAASYAVLAGVRRDAGLDAPTFRSRVRDVLVASRPALEGAGVDQCIASVQDAFVVIWSHFSAVAHTRFAWDGLLPLIKDEEHLSGARVVCRDEPPVLSITGSLAFNFVFERDDSYFLR